MLYFVASINDLDYFEAQLPDDRAVTLTTEQLSRFGYTLIYRAGSVFAFELKGVTVYAFSKPPAPIREREATMERSATQLGAL